MLPRREPERNPGVGRVLHRHIGAGEAADINGIVVATTWTSGSPYSFSGIAAGQYRIQIIPASGYSFSPQDQGGDDNSDSDVDGSGYTGYFIFDGDSSLDFDAGIYVD